MKNFNYNKINITYIFYVLLKTLCSGILFIMIVISIPING